MFGFFYLVLSLLSFHKDRSKKILLTFSMDWFLHDLDEFSPFALRMEFDDIFPPAENGEGNW